MAWDQEQLANARTIARVGIQLGASTRDILIALMTAAQESGLRNLNYGDRDSVGLFQQRDAWGSTQDRLDPAKSARMFFLGGAEGQRGLFDFASRDQMSLSQAAQSVQVSAYPDAYAKHETAMRSLLKTLDINVGNTAAKGTLGEVPGLDALLKPSGMAALQMPDAPSVTEVNGLGEITADEVGLGTQTFGSPSNGALDAMQFGMPTTDPMQHLKMPTLSELGIDVNGESTSEGTQNITSGVAPKGLIGFAKKFLGTPYQWGGSSPSGFDCSGFVQYVYAHFGITLPRLSADQARAGKQISLDQLRAGDLVALDNSSRNNGADHIGIYLGNGIVIHAPRPGSSVELANLMDVFDGGWGVRIER